jgi:hypothetical protein
MGSRRKESAIGSPSAILDNSRFLNRQEVAYMGMRPGRIEKKALEKAAYFF